MRGWRERTLREPIVCVGLHRGHGVRNVTLQQIRQTCEHRSAQLAGALSAARSQPGGAQTCTTGG